MIHIKSYVYRTRGIYRCFFSTDKSFLKEIDKTPKVDITKTYDPIRYHQINDPKFIQKILLEEEKEIKQKKYRFTIKKFKYPFFLLVFAGFIFHCWFTLPYKVVYKHASITNEYSKQAKYCYSWLIAPISIRNTQDFLVYFPVMTYSLFKLNKFLNPAHFIGFYLFNGIISGLLAYLYETQVLQRENFRGKCLGGCTTVGFMTFLMAMKPDMKFFGNKFLPYELLVIMMVCYETVVMRRNHKEISLPASILSMINGLIFGRMFRKLVF